VPDVTVSADGTVLVTVPPRAAAFLVRAP
jgi:hypothetical protein